MQTKKEKRMNQKKVLMNKYHPIQKRNVPMWVWIDADKTVHSLNRPNWDTCKYRGE